MQPASEKAVLLFVVSPLVGVWTGNQIDCKPKSNRRNESFTSH